MSIDTVQDSMCPHVFEPGLPSIAYHHLRNPDKARDRPRPPAGADRDRTAWSAGITRRVASHRAARPPIRRDGGQDRSPFSAGRFGRRLHGITSGPLWDRATPAGTESRNV
jgi:hypothetical protein